MFKVLDVQTYVQTDEIVTENYLKQNFTSSILDSTILLKNMHGRLIDEAFRKLWKRKGEIKNVTKLIKVILLV